MIEHIEEGDTYIIQKVYYLKDIIQRDDQGNQRVVTREQGLRYQIVPVVDGRPIHNTHKIPTFSTLEGAKLVATGKATKKAAED